MKEMKDGKNRRVEDWNTEKKSKEEIKKRVKRKKYCEDEKKSEKLLKEKTK